MKQFVILLISVFYIITCKSQDNSVSCKILNHFISDVKILDLFDIEISSKDTITIIDSCGSFENCAPFFSGQKKIILKHDVGKLNLDPNFRNDLNEWKNKVLIYKLVVYKSYYEIYFFYKPTNALGSVKYKIRSKKIVGIEYKLGQI